MRSLNNTQYQIINARLQVSPNAPTTFYPEETASEFLQMCKDGLFTKKSFNIWSIVRARAARAARIHEAFLASKSVNELLKQK